MNKQTDYDIVIVGAGIIGLTLACTLINQGFKIAIVDKNSDPEIDISQLRVSAITLGSQQLLESCQVWQKLPKNSLSPFQYMEVWEQGSSSRLFFDVAETGQVHLGTIIQNTVLQQALLSHAKTANDLDWFTPEELDSILYDNDNAACLLKFASGLSLTTQLVVGADGAQSSVRCLSGIQNKEQDYRQEAIVATVQTEITHQQTARQIFLPTGPLAFLPLANPHYCSIVWSTTLEEAKRLKALSDPLFCRELANAFQHHLGKIESTSLRLSFPLKAQQSEQYIKPGIALMGDAANTLHPLAGQGANLGIADALCLAKVILEAKRKQRSLGAWHILRPYERERRFHHRLMGGSVDLIKHLFAATNPFAKTTRSFGLNTIHKFSWIKNQFARYAMGNPEINLLEQS